MLAREVGPGLGWWKPVVVSHHMLMGLEGQGTPKGYDEDHFVDIQISSKMSKSRPSTCLYVHDDEEQIRQKILNAFCPERVVEGNPVLEYWKYIIFRKLKNFVLERPSKFGGDLEVDSYEELEKLFREGKIHPLDLKNSTVRALNSIIEPVRKHFVTGKAKELYQFVRGEKITR